MSSARETILADLHAKARPAEHPDAWQTQRAFGDLAAAFTEALTGAGGEVIRTGTLDEAAAQVLDLLDALGAKRVVVNAEPPLDTLDLPARRPAIEWHIAGRSPGDLRAFSTSADVGLGGAVAALAATGSVAVTSGVGSGRLAVLLPPVHVAVVPAGCLTTDIFTWAASRGGDLPASFNLISGPSKTGDIEQVLAVGVHGPKRFIAVLCG